MTTADPVETLPLLGETERGCLRRYLELLDVTLDGELVGVWVFGSVARAESWPAGMPIRSDLDLLVVTASPVAPELEQELIDATFPLFLEAGRQIGPQFRSRNELLNSPAFLDEVGRDAVPVRSSDGAHALPLP